MSKQRDRVAMSANEIEVFLDETKSLNVATMNRHGAPHLTTLWFARRDKQLLFETYGKSQKVLNIKGNPNIAVLCEAGLEYNQLRGVSITGRAKVIDQEPRLTELMEYILKQNHPEYSDKERSKVAANMARKRVVVVVEPVKTMSWDHRKLG